MDEATLAHSLTPPGDSITYVDPDDSDDKRLTVGDWVLARTGSPQSEAVQAALENLRSIDIVLPTWDRVRAKTEQHGPWSDDDASTRAGGGAPRHGRQDPAPTGRKNAVPTGRGHGQGGHDGHGGHHHARVAYRVSGFIRVRIVASRLDHDGHFAARYLGAAKCASPPGDQPPTVEGQTLAATEDTPLTFTLTATDPDSAAQLTFVLGTATHGTVALGSTPDCSTGPSGTTCTVTATYRPDADYNGADAFDYTASDGTASSAAATIRLTIAAVNDAPIGVADGLSTQRGQPVTIPVSALVANDVPGPADEGSQVLSVSGVAAGADTHGSVVLADGRVTFTPEVGFSGTARFSYTVCDDGTSGGVADPRCSTGTVSVVVAGNSAPSARDLQVSTREDVAVGVGVSGSDPDGDALQFAVVDAPAHGRLSGTPPALTYTPGADFNGSDRFTYTASDGTATSAPATVSVTVGEVNDPPVAHDDSFDLDPRGGPASPDNVTLYVTERFNSALAKVTVANGITTVDPKFATNLPGDGPDGVIFDNNGDLLTGNPVQGTISRIDAHTGQILQAQINNTVVQALADISLEPGGKGVWGIGWDFPGPMAIVRISLPDGAVAGRNPDDLAQPGGLTFNADGTRVFVALHTGEIAELDPRDGHVLRSVTTPTAPDGMTYDPTTGHVFSSGCGGLCEVDIGTDADPKLTFVGVRKAERGDGFFVDGDGISADGVGGIYVVSDFSTVYRIDLVHNTATTVATGIPWADDTIPLIGPGSDPTRRGSLTIPVSALVANDVPGPADEGSQVLSVSGVAAGADTHGSVVLADGRVTFTPEVGFSGTARFSYTVCDDGTSGGVADPRCSTGTVSVVVAGNSAPSARDLQVSTREDVAVGVGLSGRDPDGDALQFAVVDAPAHGRLSGTPPALTYTPGADFNGSDRFTYTASDGTATSAPATVSVTVGEVNDPPVAHDDALTTGADAPLEIAPGQLLSNDTPGPADESAQHLAVTAVHDTAGTHGTVALDGDQVTYTPQPGYVGPADFTYTVCDDGTTAAASDPQCVTGTVTVTVGQLPAPMIVDDMATTTTDTPVTIDVLANDTAAPALGTLDPATLTIVSPPASGLATVGAGAIGYTPNPGAIGADTFSYRVCTTTGMCGQAQVIVTVTPEHPPAATDDEYDAAENQPLQIAAPGILANDNDPDPGDTLHVMLVHGVSNGTLLLHADGAFDYTPNPGTTGIDTFTYRAIDHAGQASGDATVRIAVSGPPGPPTAAPDTYVVQQGQEIREPAPGVLGNDAAPDAHDRLRSELVDDATRGSLLLAADGSFTYAPTPGYVGVDSFTYRVRDLEGRASDPVTVIITIVGPGVPAPTANAIMPADGSRVTQPVALRATLTPPGGETVTLWSATLRRPGSGAATTLGTGTGDTVDAAIDPTRLPNGVYIVAIRAASSGGGVSVSETSVVVDGTFKPGRFTQRYTDLKLDAGTVPVSVDRVYDSADKSTGDFGVGWRLSLANFRVEANGPLGRGGWSSTTCGTFPFLATCYQSAGPHFVSVTWPDGHVEQFDLTPNNGSILTPALTTAAFTARPGTTSTLQTAGDPSVLLTGGDLLAGGLLDASGVFSPQRFILTDRYGTQYTLDRTFGLLEVRDVLGHTTTLTRDGITPSDGLPARFERDADDRIVRVMAPDGSSVHYTYDDRGDLKQVIDQDGRQTSLTYAANHELTDVAGAAPRLQLDYDDDGRVRTATDGAGNRVTLSADLSARQETSVGPDPRLTTVYSYDDQGLQTGVDQIFGGHTIARRYAYDDQRRLIRDEDPRGVTTIDYDALGNETRVRDPEGRVVEASYDALSQPLQWRVDGHRVVTATYGQPGELQHLEYPDGTDESLTYDASGRLATDVDRAGDTHTYTYGEDGLLSSVDGPLGTVGYAHDRNGRVVALTDPAGGRTTYGYDEVGNLTSFTTATGHAWNYTYDAGNRLTSEIDPLQHVRRYAYDGAGGLREAVGRTGDSVTYTRGPDGQITGITGSDGIADSFEYDPVGRLSHASNTTADVRMAWNDASDATSETSDIAGQPSPVTLARTFANGGAPMSVTDPVGTTTFGYGDFGHIDAVDDTVVGRFAFGYDDADRPTSLTRPNGVNDTFGYTRRGLAQQRTTGAGDALLNELDYQSVPGGLVSRITDADGATDYTYDRRGRLVTADHPSSSGIADESYAYDAAGNRTSWAGHPAVVLDADDRLVDDGATTYSYDDEGRQISRTDKTTGETTRFAYDALDRLTSVRGPGVDATLAYDPLGRLVSMSVNGTRTVTIYEGANPRLDYDAGGTVIARYVTAPAPGAVLGITRGGRTDYPIVDHNGTVAAVSDQAGAITDRMSYDSFGNLTRGAGSPDAQWAALRPGPAGLYLARFRAYDPTTGRFLSEDPLPADNAYSYADDNPLSLRDPTGLDDLAEEAEIRGGVYTLRDPVTNQVMRVGRTKDLWRRMLEHGRGPFAQWLFKVEFRTNVYAAQRGLEQLLFEWSGAPADLVAPIAVENANLFEYLYEAFDLLG